MDDPDPSVESLNTQPSLVLISSSPPETQNDLPGERLVTSQ